MKILLIEDDKDIAEFIKLGCEADGSVVDIAYDGAKGSYLARINAYDIIILDYSLPSKNGLDVCMEIRKQGFATPIIFLSVMGDVQTKVMALEAGADDYMEKPFSFDELIARLRAIVRRPAGGIRSSLLQVGDIVIDKKKQRVSRKNVPIYLTRKEYSLLEYFINNPGAILSRGMIMEHVWNSDSDPFSNTVEAHILNLRKKMNADNTNDIIRNVPGRGYVLEG